MCTGTGMEAERCGVRGVMRVAHIDMRNTSVNCTTPLTQYALDSGERVMCLLKQLSTELLEVCPLSTTEKRSNCKATT